MVMHQKIALAAAYLALMLALASSSYIVFGPMYTHMEETADPDGGREAKRWTSSAWDEKDTWMMFWAVFILTMTAGGVQSIRQERDMMAHGFGLVLLTFSVLTVFSIGGAVFPIALLLIISGIVLKIGKDGVER
jgi:hypothetical protein